MNHTCVSLVGSLVFLCSSCASTPPPSSSAPAQKSGTPRAGASEGPPEGLPNELPPAIGKMMDEQPCQPRLRVALDKHRLTGSDRGGSQPFLIGPGEKLCLVGDSPDALKLTDAVVPLAAQPQKLVSAEFQVIDSGSFLVIRNHFDRTLRYRAMIKPSNSREAQATTVCPVRANLVTLEHWPHAIDMIAFGDFAALAPGDPSDCR